MRTVNWIVAAAVSLTLPVGLAAADVWGGDAEPFFEMQEIYEGQRFPSIVVTMDGVVLAFRGQNAPVEVRRSEDGGETWGPIIEVGGDDVNLGAAIVDEESGDVMVFQRQRLFRSQDAGETWEEDDVTILPDAAGGVGSTHGADSGVTLQRGEYAGRLLMPARVLGPENSNAREWWPYHYNTAIFSDDGGETWQTSHPFPVLGTGEGTVAELSDGTIYYNSRIHMATDALRRIAWSEDGGETWRNPAVAEDIPDGPRGTYYGCMAGLTRLPLDDQDILIYSNLDEETDVRRGITVWASFDQGETWPVKRQVFAGPSAYSSLAVGRDETPTEGLIYLQFEGGEDHHYDGLRVARFNMAWLLDGQDPDDFIED